MNCSQILPGAVNLGPCSLAAGYWAGNPFVVYASGCDVVLLDGQLQHIQTIFGSTCGYGNTRVSCLHCAESTGRVVVAWGAEVVIFEPSSLEETRGADGKGQGAGLSKEAVEWNAVLTTSLDYPVSSICWNRDGTQLLTGGTSITFWEYSLPGGVATPFSEGVEDILEEKEEEEEDGEKEEEEEGGIVFGGGAKKEEEEEGGGGEAAKRGTLNQLWRTDVAIPIVHLKFSPNADLFASCGDNDCLVKIWYPCTTGVVGIGTPPTYSFCYVAHPRSLRGFVWRRVTPSFPKGCIPNVLLTHCTDNICRLWSHSISPDKKGCLRFFIAASIDPVADIPFRTTVPLNDQPFIVHWLNNKETTLTSKVEKYQKGLLFPVSHYSSLQSFTSALNEEMLQSWVCIEDNDETDDPFLAAKGAGSSMMRSETEFIEMNKMTGSHMPLQQRKGGLGGGFSVPNFLSPHFGGDRPGSSSSNKPPSPAGGGTPNTRSKVSVQQKRALAHLLDEWCGTPDLMLCIHPTVGSLMVWTVEGLDAPPNLERLVHVSFSSCLPHIFPPHLSQSLCQDLLQFLLKEPDALHTREATSGEGGGVMSSVGGVSGSVVTDISIPVPQIRISSAGSMSAMSHLEVAEDVPKIKSDSTLIIVSSHTNGSLNTWSVELTIQSNFCTSIAGLIHCAGTGGHCSKVDRIHRHPWLPIVMTISSSHVIPPFPSPPSPTPGGLPEVIVEGEEVEVPVEEAAREGDLGTSELIIWNADLPEPLQHKSKLNELSRIVAPGTQSFNHMTWVPPIAVGGLNEGALARCPCSGLFVANVATQLILFQASLYTITKPQPSSFMQSDRDKERVNEQVPSSYGLHGIQVTSQLGVKGISIVDMIGNLSDFDVVVDLHAFRMCSLITSLDLKKSLTKKFRKDLVLVLVENKKPQDHTHHHHRRHGDGTARPTTISPASTKGTKSYVHLWQITVSSKPCEPHSPQFFEKSSSDSKPRFQPDVYASNVRKVFSGPFPLPAGTCVVDSSPACDISSSLQLQTPTLSAPFLFATSCSDGTIRCWQFSLKCPETTPTASTMTLPVAGSEIEFSFYEVFDSAATSKKGVKLRPSPLDCYEEELIKSLPTQSYVPSGFKMAYPGRLAMAHLLSKPSTKLPTSTPSSRRSSISFERPPSRVSSHSTLAKGSNPLDRLAMVSVWECESTGGLRWLCETDITLVGVAQVATKKGSGGEMSVLMDWIPMENGAYLLATCFASTMSIFGMSLPQDDEQFTMQRKRVGFLPKEKTGVLKRVKSLASWVCLIQFPCFRPSLDLSVSCLAYSGSNSIVVSIGSEVHLYSCWVSADKLVSFLEEHEHTKLSKGAFGRVVIQEGAPNQSTTQLAESEVVNLLDYAHARNTPLPQYHPKILMELMNSGKLHAVKAILINLTKFLLLYQAKKARPTGDPKNYFDRGGIEEIYEDDSKKQKGLLSLSTDGFLQRNKQAKPKSPVERIPHLPLNKIGIVLSSKGVAKKEADLNETFVTSPTDDYDELFSLGRIDDSALKLGFDDEEEEELGVQFPDLEPEKGEFTPKLAEVLTTILSTHQLADLGELEQIRLLSIADTVASTKMSFDDTSSYPQEDVAPSDDTPTASVSLGLLSGAGYASTGGSKGREAMDSCGLRYLLALESYIMLSEVLPEDVSPGPLPPSKLVWAFHSDAETELLAAIPCVQRDELKWEELRNAGVGWWLRSLDTLKRLIEKLAKAQFMRNQQPLDASLFYLAMKKQSLLRGLFKSVSDTKLTAFFGNNFTESTWKNKAQKNAFALLGKQRFEEAAAFFLLAGRLWDAVEVCMSNLNDLQLAFVIIRLYEGDHGTTYRRFLKECILGVQSSPVEVNNKKKRVHVEMNPDPFLRSIAHWLLQDCSSALETLLVTPDNSTPSAVVSDGGGATPLLHAFYANPAIFNFYFYLRSHPLLVRRQHKSAGTSFVPSQLGAPGPLSKPSNGYLSGVGDEPLTAVERSLLFSTAYCHLCYGCPLLVLNVLSRLPDSDKLGEDVCKRSVAIRGAETISNGGPSSAGLSWGAGGGGGGSMAGMIESGNLTVNGDSGTGGGDDDFDWGAPVSSQSQRFKAEEEEEEVDWSKPLAPASDRFGASDEVDWSKPFSQRFSLEDSSTLSSPDFNSTSLTEDTHTPPTPSQKPHPPSSPPTSCTLTPQGLFILTLAKQLQYNACLSILTEELHSIYLPACCHFLWSARGKEALPILPLPEEKVDTAGMGLSQHYSKNVLDRTVQNLRGMLMDWLKGETTTVREVCWMNRHGGAEGREGEKGEGEGEEETGTTGRGDVSTTTVDMAARAPIPAGYDLLTTLMNYASLHAATSPSLLTVKFELMHLVNTLLPWSTGSNSRSSHSSSNQSSGKDVLTRQDTSFEIVPTCAINPAQLPILTSCSLPVRHLTNLATHLRLLSGCVVKVLTEHVYPPIHSQPLPQAAMIFELCCAISHCITISLNPTFLSEEPSISSSSQSNQSGLTSSVGSLGSTPTPSFAELHHRGSGGALTTAAGGDSTHHSTPPQLVRQRMDSFSNQDSTLGTPNSKPAKWPGVNNWPQSLTSDEGRDPTALSVVLMECMVSVYLGLLATAWSQHAIEDILILLKNGPSMDIWYSSVGGGVTGKKSERILAKSFVSQTIETMAKKFRRGKQASSESPEDGAAGTGGAGGGASNVDGVFIAPKRSLLDHFLSLPAEEVKEKRVKPSEDSSGFLMIDEEEESDRTESETDDDEDNFGTTGITFSINSPGEGVDFGGGDTGLETGPANPNCFAWCLMNLCISKILQQVVRKMVAGVGLELMELVTVSTLLYSILKVLDEWESIFTRRLEALGEAPDDLFGTSEDQSIETSKFRMGISLMRHKFLLEPENSPFRGRDKPSRHARRLWQYLVRHEDSRETIIHYVFVTKGGVSSSPSGSIDEEVDVPQELTCKVIHKEHDSIVSAFCLNSCSRAQTTVLAMALPREVMEIEIPDLSLLDSSSQAGEVITKGPYSPKRSSVSLAHKNDDFIMVQSTSQLRPKRTKTFTTTQIRHSIATLSGLPSPTSSPALAHGQTGSNTSLLIRRHIAGVKRMAPHPSLAYYLTGSIDGSVIMWEFGTPRAVATQRQPGAGGSVTKIRFTPEGNKFGVTDSGGKLSLWQGIHTYAREAYHVLHTSMRYLSDFLFLGSSSFIATCGDGVESKNLYLWDTLMPTNRSIVKEFACHESGATSLGYSLTRQRLFCGSKKGEICIFDIRQCSLLHCLPVHSSAINCIVVNDIDGYIVTGAMDGDIKVIDSSTLSELASFPGQHSKSRLFRHGEGGVTDLDIMPGGKLYSCGADGSIKCQTLKF